MRYSTSVFSVLAACGVMVFPMGMAYAETPGDSSAVSSPDYQRYTPAMCAQPALQALTDWRSGADTMYANTIAYRPSATLVSAVSACAARFSADTLPVLDRYALGRTYALIGRDEEARPIFTKMLGMLTSPSERAWFLYRIVRLYATEGPANYTEAQAYFKQLEEIKDAGMAERVLARLEMAVLAQQLDSLPLWGVHSEAALELVRAFPVDTSKKYATPMIRVYFNRADYHVRLDQFDQARSLAQEIENVIRRVRSRYSSSVQFTKVRYAALGTVAPDLEATQWALAGADSVSLRGRVGIVAFVRHDCESQCYRGYQALRHLATEFPDVKVVLTANTGGYYRTRLVPVSEEAELVSSYFQKELGIPAPLAIWETTFTRREMDGRFLVKRTPNSTAYNLVNLSRALREPIAFLIDKQGKIRRNVSLVSESPVSLRHTLRQLLDEQ